MNSLIPARAPFYPIFVLAGGNFLMRLFHWRHSNTQESDKIIKRPELQ